MSNTIGLPIQKDYLIKNDSYIKEPKPFNGRAVVKVGDDKKPGIFEPQTKIEFIGNTSNVSLRFDTENEKGKNTKEGRNKLKYELEGREVEFFETKNGYELGLTVHQKPKSNKFKFSLRDKNVVYHKQPDIDKLSKADRARLPEDSFQPENIKGAYAVFAKERAQGVKDHDFQDGHLAWIYRPYVKSRNGDIVWCEQDIKDNILTVTVPQDFIDDSKVYPFFLDPEIGDSTSGGTEATISASTKNTCDKTASRHLTASSNQITRFYYYGFITAGSGLIEVGAYNMGATNLPDTATLASSADITITNNSAAWLQSADVDFTLTDGDNYAAAIGDARPTGGTIKGYYVVVGSGDVSETSTTGPLDAVWNEDDGELTYHFKYYALVEAAPGPPVFSGTIADQSFARTGSVSIPTASFFSNPQTFSAANLPAFLSINTSTGEITNTGSNVNGFYTNVTVTCSNALSPPTATSNTFSITILAQNPVWTSSINNRSGNVGSQITPIDLSLLVDHVDSGGYALVGWPSGLSVDAAGLVTGTPTTEQVYAGCYVDAINADNTVASNAFTYTIGAALPVPTITGVNGGNNLQRGASITITGTNFEDPTLGLLTFKSIALTVTAGNATSMTVDVPDEGFIFGEINNLEFTNQSGYTATESEQFLPETGYSYTTLSVSYAQLPTNSVLDNVVGLENLLVGDQVMYETSASPEGTASFDDQGVLFISGATAAGDYLVNYLINRLSSLTVSSNGVALITLQGSGADVNAPSWVSTPSVGQITTDGGTLTATINETGSIFASIVPSAETTPSIPQVKLGQNAAGAAADDAASVSNNTAINYDITGLDPDTFYDAVLVAEDDELTPNTQASVTVYTFQTDAVVDNTPPVFVISPAVSQITTSTCILNASTDEPATIFWVIIPGGYQDPQPVEIISNNISSPGDGVVSAPFSGSGSELVDVLVTSMSPGETWKACFAARDSAGNVQVSSTIRPFETSPVGTVRSLNEQLLNRINGAAIANTLLDYAIQSSFGGNVTDSGQVTTDGSGNYSITNLTVAAGLAWITFKDAATGLKVATGEVTITEA